jgi:hypothetical protein
MTPIKSIQKTETVNFGKEPVQYFWLERPAASQSESSNIGYLSRLKTCLESSKDGVICVFSEELSSKNLCESFAKARDNGNRIYILTNDYHAEMKNLEGCLMRYGGGRRIGSFILINPNSNSSSGLLFTGMFSDGSINFSTNLMLNLDGSQASVLFRYFCYQFWNKAEKERVEDEHTVDASPLDIYPPVEDSCDFQYLMSVWGKETQNAQVYTSSLNENSYLKFNNFSNSTFFTILPGINTPQVRSLKQKNNRIYAFDSGSYLNAVQTPEGIWLVPKIDASSEEEVYAIFLNTEQKETLKKHLIKLSDKTSYEYFENGIRENLSGKYIFHLDNSISQKYSINAVSRKRIESISPMELQSKDVFEKLKPDFPDDHMSVLLTYEWTNIPFSLPRGSKEHQLYNDWKEAERKIHAYIDNIQRNISETEKNKGMFSRIMKIFVGKEQKFSEYRRNLDRIKSIKYSSTETMLGEEIKLLNEIRASVERDSSEISEENRKAVIQEQIVNKKNEKKQCEENLDNERKNLQETEKIIKIQSDDLDVFRKKANETIVEDEAKIKNEGKKLDDLNVEKNKISKEITSLEPSIKKDTDDEKVSADENEKYKDILSDKKKKLNEIEENLKNQSANLEGLKKQFKEKNDENEKKIKEKNQKIGDLKIAKNRIASEIDSLENKIRKLAGETTALGEELKHPVKEVPKKESVLSGLSGKKTVQSSQIGELVIPQFSPLPSTGELYTHNGQDYLAIMNWEEYDQGRNEAKRLNAKLCAKGENNG